MGSDLLRAVEIPDQKLVNGGAPLPQVLAPTEDRAVAVDELVDWIKREKALIEGHLLRSGAVLLRGCGVKSAADFNSVVEAFGYEERLYTGGMAQRSHVVGRVYTSNESPPDVYIPFHHEMAQLPNSPSAVFFFCEQAPTEGGETPLLWSRSIVERMEKECPDFMQQLKEKGLLYQIFFGDEDIPNAYVIRSWRTLYKMSRQELDEKIAEVGQGVVRIEWIDGHGLKMITGPVPALKWDAKRQQHVFFNYMVMLICSEYEVLDRDKEVASFDKVVFGDGSPLPKDQVRICQRLMAEEKAEFKWETGDVLLVDNVAVQHSRNPCFSPRRVLASLVA